ncbi:MAG: hypothetical protein ABEK00_02935 [Candidatus Nanohaloarchaea archaeon]
MESEPLSRPSGSRITKTIAISLVTTLLVSFSTGLPGEGTESQPYRIDSCRDLQQVDQGLDTYYLKVNEVGNPTGEVITENTEDHYYEVTSDIDCTGTVTWNSGKGFDPIGGNVDDDKIYLGKGIPEKRFNGVLEGNNHTVKGLTIDRWTAGKGSYDQPNRSIGIFGYIGEEGTVKNLRIVGARIGGFRKLGIVAGENHGTIQNVYASGTIKSKSYIYDWLKTDTYHPEEIGGIAGLNTGEIRRSVSTARIRIPNSTKVGGIAGRNTGKIQETMTGGKINGSKDLGGIAGTNFGKIENSYTVANLTGNIRVGGLTGGPSSERINPDNDLSLTVTGGDYFDTDRVSQSPENFSITDSYSAARIDAPDDFKYREAKSGMIHGGNTSKLGEEHLSDVYYVNRTAGEKGVPEPVTETQAVGGSAREHMEDLDFQDVWMTIDSSKNGYEKSGLPALRHVNDEIQYELTKREEQGQTTEGSGPASDNSPGGIMSIIKGLLEGLGSLI